MADDKSTSSSGDKIALHGEGTDISFGAGILFLTGVAFASTIGGLGLTLGRARRKSPAAFGKRHDEATRLALKALALGTVYAVSGVGIMVFGVKTALGVKDTKEFGEKMKGILPTEDGKLVTYFESWRLPRNRGTPDLWAEQWFGGSKSRDQVKEDLSGDET